MWTPGIEFHNRQMLIASSKDWLARSSLNGYIFSGFAHRNLGGMIYRFTLLLEDWVQGDFSKLRIFRTSFPLDWKMRKHGDTHPEPGVGDERGSEFKSVFTLRAQHCQLVAALLSSSQHAMYWCPSVTEPPWGTDSPSHPQPPIPLEQWNCCHSGELASQLYGPSLELIKFNRFYGHGKLNLTCQGTNAEIFGPMWLL